MVIRRMVGGRREKFFELRIAHRIAIDTELRDVQLVYVVAAGRSFPGILHVDAFIVHAFNLDAGHAEDIVGGRDQEHIVSQRPGVWRRSGRHHRLR